MRPSMAVSLMLLSLILGSGCATGSVPYSKAGSTEADRKRDVAECTRDSIGHEAGRHVFSPVVIDRAAYESCLESRGYTRAR